MTDYLQKGYTRGIVSTMSITWIMPFLVVASGLITVVASTMSIPSSAVH